mmetsp:Transcript_137072/g.238336  ORF Transcript_137072/g.238336 Transcript_137072/m.238336 type:complete len:260 (-) Transcript_137072:644-1423(-)
MVHSGQLLELASDGQEGFVPIGLGCIQCGVLRWLRGQGRCRRGSAALRRPRAVWVTAGAPWTGEGQRCAGGAAIIRHIIVRSRGLGLPCQLLWAQRDQAGPHGGGDGREGWARGRRRGRPSHAQRGPQGHRLDAAQRGPQGGGRSAGQRGPHGGRLSAGQRGPQGCGLSAGQRGPQGCGLSAGRRGPQGCGLLQLHWLGPCRGCSVAHRITNRLAGNGLQVRVDQLLGKCLQPPCCVIERGTLLVVLHGIVVDGFHIVL